LVTFSNSIFLHQPKGNNERNNLRGNRTENYKRYGEE